MTTRQGHCGCTPGTAETGWRELRSEACVRAELNAWSGIQETAKRLASEIRSECLPRPS